MTETRTITIERTYPGLRADVWELWTTRAGIEAWWGPDGFAVTVHEIDVRVGGVLRYAMTAVAADMVAFTQRQGMPVTTEQRVVYTEVAVGRRLTFTSLADFIPGVEPYDVATTVELTQTADGVRTVVTIEAMHDEVWTQRAVMGWESELEKLAVVLAARRA